MADPKKSAVETLKPLVQHASEFCAKNQIEMNYMRIQGANTGAAKLVFGNLATNELYQGFFDADGPDQEEWNDALAAIAAF